MIAINDVEPQIATLKDRHDEDIRRHDLFAAVWKAESVFQPPAPTEPPDRLFRKLRVEHDSRDNPVTWGY